MAKTSNTQRTLKALRDQGCVCGMVERFNPHAGPFGIRIDLFGFLDIIAVDDTIRGIQSCGQSFAEHDRKILANDVAPKWLAAGGIIELWGWRKLLKKRGGKQKIWVPRIKIYTMEDFK